MIRVLALSLVFAAASVANAVLIDDFSVDAGPIDNQLAPGPTPAGGAFGFRSLIVDPAVGPPGVVAEIADGALQISSDNEIPPGAISGTVSYTDPSAVDLIANGEKFLVIDVSPFAIDSGASDTDVDLTIAVTDSDSDSDAYSVAVLDGFSGILSIPLSVFDAAVDFDSIGALSLTVAGTTGMEVTIDSVYTAVPEATALLTWLCTGMVGLVYFGKRNGRK